ncbi:MAG: hypothetical protein JW966_02445 [Anaerolineae bacterium]|nr:hypothetical protein [Anaerolineae bacterium]
MSETSERGLFQSNLIRLVLVLLIVGVVLVVVGVVGYMQYRSSRDKPLKVDTYPGAQLVGNEVLYDGYDHQQYVSSDPIDTIEQFYAKQDMDCEPQYATIVERPGEEPVREGYLYTRCLRDRSSLGMTQYTTVVLQPEQDEAGNATGQVVIDVRRYWGN